MPVKKKTSVIPESEEIEVVMTKKMKYGEYLNSIPLAKRKGWNIQGFQIGFFSKGIRDEV